MGWLDFIASIFGSLVKLGWPATIAFSVWLFRNKIEELLPYLRIKYKDIDVSLARAEQTAAALPPPPPPPPDVVEVEHKEEENFRFERFAEYSPRGAIAAMRIEVESAVRDLYQSLPNTEALAGRKPSMAEMTRLLRKSQKLSSGTLLLLDEIRLIGNQAVHGEGVVTTDDALRYRELAHQAISIIFAAKWHEDVPNS